MWPFYWIGGEYAAETPGEFNGPGPELIAAACYSEISIHGVWNRWPESYYYWTQPAQSYTTYCPDGGQVGDLVILFTGGGRKDYPANMTKPSESGWRWLSAGASYYHKDTVPSAETYAWGINLVGVYWRWWEPGITFTLPADYCNAWPLHWCFTIWRNVDQFDPFGLCLFQSGGAHELKPASKWSKLLRWHAPYQRITNYLAYTGYKYEDSDLEYKMEDDTGLWSKMLNLSYELTNDPLDYNGVRWPRFPPSACYVYESNDLTSAFGRVHNLFNYNNHGQMFNGWNAYGVTVNRPIDTWLPTESATRARANWIVGNNGFGKVEHYLWRKVYLTPGKYTYHLELYPYDDITNSRVVSSYASVIHPSGKEQGNWIATPRDASATYSYLFTPLGSTGFLPHEHSNRGFEKIIGVGSGSECHFMFTAEEEGWYEFRVGMGPANMSATYVTDPTSWDRAWTGTWWNISLTLKSCGLHRGWVLLPSIVTFEDPIDVGEITAAHPQYGIIPEVLAWMAPSNADVYTGGSTPELNYPHRFIEPGSVYKSAGGDWTLLADTWDAESIDFYTLNVFGFLELHASGDPATRKSNRQYNWGNEPSRSLEGGIDYLTDYNYDYKIGPYTAFEGKRTDDFGQSWYTPRSIWRAQVDAPIRYIEFRIDWQSGTGLVISAGVARSSNNTVDRTSSGVRPTLYYNLTDGLMRTSTFDQVTGLPTIGSSFVTGGPGLIKLWAYVGLCVDWQNEEVRWYIDGKLAVTAPMHSFLFEAKWNNCWDYTFYSEFYEPSVNSTVFEKTDHPINAVLGLDGYSAGKPVASATINTTGPFQFKPPGAKAWDYHAEVDPAASDYSVTPNFVQFQDFSGTPYSQAFTITAPAGFWAQTQILNGDTGQFLIAGTNTMAPTVTATFGTSTKSTVLAIKLTDGVVIEWLYVPISLVPILVHSKVVGDNLTTSDGRVKTLGSYSYHVVSDALTVSDYALRATNGGAITAEDAIESNDQVLRKLLRLLREDAIADFSDGTFRGINPNPAESATVSDGVVFSVVKGLHEILAEDALLADDSNPVKSQNRIAAEGLVEMTDGVRVARRPVRITVSDGFDVTESPLPNKTCNADDGLGFADDAFWSWHRGVHITVTDNISSYGYSPQAQTNYTLYDYVWGGYIWGGPIVKVVEDQCLPNDYVNAPHGKFPFMTDEVSLGYDEAITQPKYRAAADTIAVDDSYNKLTSAITYTITSSDALDASDGKSQYKGAAKVYYPDADSPVAGSFAVLGTSAPSDAMTTTGWTVGKTAANYRSETLINLINTSFNNTADYPPFPYVYPPSNGFRTASTLTGTFVAGNWTLSMRVSASVAGGSQDGYLKARLWRYTNGDGGGSSTQIAEATSNTLTDIPTSPAQTVSMTFSSVPETTLSGEYLFVTLSWHITGAGSKATCDVMLYKGSADKLTSPVFY